MSIKIITDSTTELSPKEAKELDVAVIPLKTLFGEKEYLDGIDFTPEQFYTKLAQSDVLPTTSQPSPAEFEQFYREAQADGSQIIVICLAASISGTYQSANIAKETCGGDIRIIDSGTATVGLQILVRRAIGLRNEGKTADEIVAIIEEEKKSVCVFAAIDTLEYLYKGGRLSRTSAFAGTLLSIKPLISLSQGELKAIGKCKGQSKAYHEIFKLVEAAGGIDYSKPFGIGYTGDRSQFERFEQMCEPYFAGKKPIIGNIGSVIGTHIGPGAAAIVFFKNPS
ncbi:MAG: DegV family protein [Lachnospiraceae bacterium]|nr:DegV family protein [Lachnospiraceae bacterium]